MSVCARVAIIGGGWSGLSCAQGISALLPNTKISLFEQSPHLGGRARGIIWQPREGINRYIDNGQHLAIGAYQETVALLARSGAPAWQRESLNWVGITAPGAQMRSWKISSSAWPQRAFSSIFGANAPKGWPMSWRLSLARTIAQLIRNHWQCSETADAWLKKQNAPGQLIEHFWRPLTEGALNTEFEQACAQTLAHVLRDSLAGPEGATDVLTPSVNLSVDGVDHLERYLNSRGIRIQTGTRVLRIAPDNTLTYRKGDSENQEQFDAIVLALPGYATQTLWQESCLPQTNASHRWESLQYRNITTAWIDLDEKLLLAMRQYPSWFVLDDCPGVQRIAQVCVQRPGVLACVMSAHQSTDPDQKALLARQLYAQLGISVDHAPQKWISEKKATWACTPDTPRASEEEALGHTEIKGIFRAADDLHPHYPATIESAVRCGQICAQTVTEYLKNTLRESAKPI